MGSFVVKLYARVVSCTDKFVVDVFAEKLEKRKINNEVLNSIVKIKAEPFSDQ